jgi:hypothetical protein
MFPTEFFDFSFKGPFYNKTKATRLSSDVKQKEIP